MIKSRIELENHEEEERFKKSCEDPRIVAKYLEEHQRWRKGEDEEEGEAPNPPPLSPKALTIVEDAAIEWLNKISGIKLTRNQTQWWNDLLDMEESDKSVAARTEHLWEIGAENEDAAAMHSNNHEELMGYVQFIRKMRELCS